MQNIKSRQGDGLLDRLFWDLSFKNRKILLPILIGLILVIGIVLVQKFLALEAELKKSSDFQPVYVMAVNRNLNVGDLIHKEDLSPMIFSKKEFTKVLYHDAKDNLDKPALINCSFDQKTKAIKYPENLIGRVVKFPILANSAIRKEFLAPENSLAGLENLLAENQSLIDIEVPQSGFNIFLRPGNKVDLVETSTASPRILVSNAEVILVDSRALGQGDFIVETNPSLKRNITVVIPKEHLSDIAKAKKSQNLLLTLSKSSSVKEIEQKTTIRQTQQKQQKPFQTLTMILGSDKEVIRQ